MAASHTFKVSRRCWFRETAVVDFRRTAEQLASDILQEGGAVILGARHAD